MPGEYSELNAVATIMDMNRTFVRPGSNGTAQASSYCVVVSLLILKPRNRGISLY